MGILICICGDTDGSGVGEEAGDGIAMPGIFCISSGDAPGFGDADGGGDGDGDGIGMPLMSMPPMSSFFGAGVCCFFFCGFGFGLGLGLGLPIFIPGISCMFRAPTDIVPTNSRAMTASEQASTEARVRTLNVKVLELFMIPSPKYLKQAIKTKVRLDSRSVIRFVLIESKTYSFQPYSKLKPERGIKCGKR
jgi:hypothetical protein